MNSIRVCGPGPAVVLHAARAVEAIPASDNPVQNRACPLAFAASAGMDRTSRSCRPICAKGALRRARRNSSDTASSRKRASPTTPSFYTVAEQARGAASTSISPGESSGAAASRPRPPPDAPLRRGRERSRDAS